MTRDTIGCSELGALFGVDPRCTRRHLYLRLIGEAPERTTKLYMLAGQMAEGAIAAWYLERHPGYRWDAKYARREDPAMVRGRLHGHPDGLITLAGEDVPSVNGEIKLAQFDRYPWRHGVPLWYQWQAQGQMALAGFKACVVVECVDLELRGDEVVHMHCREHLVARDESVHAAILEECERFFSEHVIPRVPPPAVADDLHDLKAQPPQPSAAITLTGPADNLAHDWLVTRHLRAEAQRSVTALDKQLAAHEAKLLEAIGSAAQVRTQSGAVIERKARHRREFVMPASTTYTLSYKEPKT